MLFCSTFICYPKPPSTSSEFAGKWRDSGARTTNHRDRTRCKRVDIGVCFGGLRVLCCRSVLLAVSACVRRCVSVCVYDANGNIASAAVPLWWPFFCMLFFSREPAPHSRMRSLWYGNITKYNNNNNSHTNTPRASVLCV